MKSTYTIGVDFGGTNLRIAAYAERTDFLDIIELPTCLSDGRDAVVRRICEAVASLMHREFGPRHLAGIGIGSPGPLELPEGILHHPPNLPGWDGFNLRHAVESTLGHPVEIESDANLAALAEQRLGAGRRFGVDDLCFLTLGTGVGSGVILNRNIWHGSAGMGGEAGHIIVKDENGVPCGCGSYGCVEQYASATAVVRMARELLGPAGPATAREVADLAHGGNPDAISVFHTVGHALAVCLTGLINTLNLPLYTLGGGLTGAWDLFAPTMFREIRERSYVYKLTQPESLEPEELERHKSYILKAQLGSSAGLLGACLLPLQGQSVESNRQITPSDRIPAVIKG